MNKSLKIAAIVVLLCVIGGFCFGIYSKKQPTPVVEEVKADSLKCFEKLDSFDLAKADKFSYAAGLIQTDGFVNFADSGLHVSKKMFPYLVTGLSRVAERDTTDWEKSYRIGLSVGLQLSIMFENIAESFYMKQVSNGLKNTFFAGFATDSAKYSIDEARMNEVNLGQKLREKNAGQKYRENKEKGEAFINKKAAQGDVQRLPKGTLYKEIKRGTGRTPSSDQKVTIHYSISLIDGTIVDSSYDKGKPVTMPVYAVIPGFSEALSHMKVGSVWEVYIPQDLAYGSRTQGSILPFSALVAKIELISIK